MGRYKFAPALCFLRCCSASSSVVEGARGGARLVQTAKYTGDRLTPQQPVAFKEVSLDVDGAALYVGNDRDQTITGFGGAFTEAASIVYQSLTEARKRYVLERYFSTDGLGYTVGRVPINSCDFSPTSYSFDDVADDFNLTHFDSNLTHDMGAMIPFIRASLEVSRAAGREIKLFGSPWSPPAWMKSNGAMDSSGTPGLKDDAREAWAHYFVKWIAGYKAHGIPIWAVTPQNEPEYAAPWEACVYDPEQEADFIGSYLGPALRDAHPEVKILAYDHNKDHVYDWAATMLSHPTAKDYVHGIAIHWYAGDHFENVRAVHRAYPNATVLATEATYERYRWEPGSNLVNGSWTFGEGYAHDIIGDLLSGSTGWTDWNLLLDLDGGPNHVGNVCASAMVAPGSDTVYLHPQYYFMGHFSKYILPGSVRLGTTLSGTSGYAGPPRGYGTCTGDDGLEAVAFLRPDDLVAVVVLNCANTSMPFKLVDGNQMLDLAIPARAIQTLLYPRISQVDIVI